MGARSDIVLLAHSAMGVIGILASLWVFVETLSASESNARRIRRAALIAAAAMIGAWICGGDWYLHFYPIDKAIILKGPWPWGHTLFMETKEHLFFITLILSLYLPIAAADSPHRDAAARGMVLSVSLLIVASGLAIEGCGAVINHAAKIAMARKGPFR